MKNSKNYLALAFFLAAIAVALGAFGAHGLKKIAMPEQVASFQTGVQYLFYHAVAIALVAMTMQFFPIKWLSTAQFFFILGIICFSGSLCLFTFMNINNLYIPTFARLITPLGGIFFLFGWTIAGYAILKKS